MNTTTKDAPLMELWQEMNTTKDALLVELWHAMNTTANGAPWVEL